MTAPLEFRSHFTVALQPLGLVERPLIPIEPQPFHALENCLAELGFGTVCVRVFDAQNEHAAVVPRKEPVVKRRARPAYVQVTCR